MLDDMPPVQRLVTKGMPSTWDMLRDGIQFSHYSGNDPLCCPGRANFLTGQYSHHHGVTTMEGNLLDTSMTLATQLRAAGYHTMIAGKYLNGLKRIPDKTPLGWDRAAITDGRYFEYDLWRDDVVERHGSTAADYSTDVIRSHAVDFLRAAPGDQPVFLMLTPSAPHAGSDPRYRWMPDIAPRHAGDRRCRDIGVRSGPGYLEADVSDKPTIIARRPNKLYPNGWPLERNCQALLAVDEMFARVRAELQRQGRFDTLFVLTADNGMAWNDHRWPTKTVPYSTPIPLYVRWSGHDGGPRVVTEWTQNVDLAPTLAAVGGTSMGPYPNGQTVPDGLDLSAVIAGTGTIDRQSLLEERAATLDTIWTTGWFALRTTDWHPLGLWHYVEWDDGQLELYDLIGDPHELQNLADDEAHGLVRDALALELAERKAALP